MLLPRITCAVQSDSEISMKSSQSKQNLKAYHHSYVYRVISNYLLSGIA